MKEDFDPSVLSKESKSILSKFYGDLHEISMNTMKLNALAIYDGHPIYGQKLGQVKGHLEEQKSALAKCREIRDEILTLIHELDGICSQVEDVSMGLVNSFETPYDCDMFYKGAKYMAKFIKHSEHWSCANAKEEWKEDYDRCVKLFNEVTAGLNTHNFQIFTMNDGSKAYFGFTVHGVPGDFEVSFPLNSKDYFVEKHWLDSSGEPMQMHLTWRRHWTIPVLDYFFDDFGSYDISEVNVKLFEFISTEKWKDFYNTKSYMKEVTDPKTFKTTKVEVEYDYKTQNYLEQILKEEIEACSREGKKVR